MTKIIQRLGFLLFPVLSYAAAGAADLARGMEEVNLDTAECYRVHDLQINKDDIHLYFTAGYLIFSKPVSGARTAAVFTTEVEAGDAEVLLLPPDRSERRSLAAYSGSPNLDEHLEAAVLLFGDDTYEDLMRQIRANEFNKPSPEMGALMADQWNSVVRHLTSSFESRLLLDLLSPRRRQHGFFIAVVNGKRLGNFDVIYEPRAAEQISVGQLTSRNNQAFFDVWTNFEAAAFRKGARQRPGPDFAVKKYTIDATLQPDLQLRAVSKVRVSLAESGETVLPFDITARMKVLSAAVDGQPAEILQPDSLRENLIRNNGDELFLVVAPHPLAAGDHEVEFHHEGAVVQNAGNQVYFVGARGTWYPNAGLQFAPYDLRFRYPKDLDLVTPGEVVSDKTEDQWRVTERVTSVPIRFAGFNLGVYDRTRVMRDSYTIEVCANRALERALQPKAGGAVMPPNAGGEKLPSPAGVPSVRLQELAADIGSAFDFMAGRFGPPPLKTLEVSPIPGFFGQGFPGLLYLSTMSYLRRQDPALANLDADEQSFFVDLLQAHETAHQWWGNIVTTSGYHDDWLTEALANYSALLYLEKSQGRQLLDSALNRYRKQLLDKGERSQTIESTGPIVLGSRLQTSQAPLAWTRILYGKGSWIMHMICSRMGEERFMSLLGELRRRYEWKSITTEEFRRLASEFLPADSPDPKLEAFFDQWVYDTGIPSFKLSYSIHGKAPAVKVTGTVSQGDEGPEFNAEIPVEFQLGQNRQVHWVKCSSSMAPFTVVLPQAPASVTVDTSSILALLK
ncbi:MAG TPA: M1 family aminopeptidase [Bryobacteraceae bacterium]|nr:M1 family aminopeptidase [Bryobacteraceae bacterium]